MVLFLDHTALSPPHLDVSVELRVVLRQFHNLLLILLFFLLIDLLSIHILIGDYLLSVWLIDLFFEIFIKFEH